jgi:hypothetical protein
MSKIIFIQFFLFSIVFCLFVQFSFITAILYFSGVNISIFKPAILVFIPCGFAVNLMLAREVYISGYFVDRIQKLSSSKFSKLLILSSLGLFNFVYLFFYEINTYNKIFTFMFCFPVLNLYFYIGIIRIQVQKGEDLHSILKKYFKLQLISYVIKKEGL